ncbi:MAG: enoyl-CoA hydratase [Deltaproteobacteria bacterium RIFCSPLOWO2_12_FULL_50_11]|nr:MAG: enoyl-CoA hydratase [Deltaproteobacteria bacterium RIFCSPLOWO2_12_FULL_50_11]
MGTLEILREFNSKVGQEISVGPWFLITQERIHQFAEATLDRQWLHTDPDRARRESPYGTTVAHGYLTLSLLPHLMGSLASSQKDFPDMKFAVNYGLNKVRFPHPVKVGSKIRARTFLQGVEAIDGGIQLVRKVTIEIEDVAKPACVAETVVRLYFREENLWPR